MLSRSHIMANVFHDVACDVIAMRQTNTIVVCLLSLSVGVEGSITLRIHHGVNANISTNCSRTLPSYFNTATRTFNNEPTDCPLQEYVYTWLKWLL